MRISDWSSDVCSSDLGEEFDGLRRRLVVAVLRDDQIELSAAGEHIALPLLESILASLQLLAALRLHLLEVIFLPVEEDDAVGVLLKIAAFLEIGHHRPLVCARLNSAREQLGRASCRDRECQYV